MSHLARLQISRVQKQRLAVPFSTSSDLSSPSANEKSRHQESSVPAVRIDHQDDATLASKFHPVYVHYVSKVILQYLQDSRSPWLKQQGLDRNLHLNANGTFSLQFPSRPGFDAGYIWTSYEKATRQHWLSVNRPGLMVRFLVKENNSGMAQALSSRVQWTEERITKAVDEMIEAVSLQQHQRENM